MQVEVLVNNDEGLASEYTDDGMELKSYGYNSGSLWSSNPLFLSKGDEYYWYVNDNLGTPQQLVAENDVSSGRRGMMLLARQR